MTHFIDNIAITFYYDALFQYFNSAQTVDERLTRMNHFILGTIKQNMKFDGIIVEEMPTFNEPEDDTINVFKSTVHHFLGQVKSLAEVSCHIVTFVHYSRAIA